MLKIKELEFDEGLEMPEKQISESGNPTHARLAREAADCYKYEIVNPAFQAALRRRGGREWS